MKPEERDPAHFCELHEEYTEPYVSGVTQQIEWLCRAGNREAANRDFDTKSGYPEGCSGDTKDVR